MPSLERTYAESGSKKRLAGTCNAAQSFFWKCSKSGSSPISTEELSSVTSVPSPLADFINQNDSVIV